MGKVTRAAARNRQGAIITEYGQTPRKNTKELTEAEQKLYGELTLHIKDYRLLPVDDPKRMEIEKTLSGLR